MEEISAQEAAGSPRVQFQSLETQSECFPPEPQFLQDTDMEQGLTGGILLRLPITRIHCVNSCPALSHTQASAFSGGKVSEVFITLVLKRWWPKYRISIGSARPCSETPFPGL
uniref:Zinc finger protein 655 n=1 Tax=Spermophilus dauricus TaxID=99837 RepID=A0A8C9QUZ5_SPEDA